MRKLTARAMLAAMLVASSVSVAAAPAKPPKPTPPAPPTNPTPGGDFVQCMATGASVQVCSATTGH